MKTKFSLIAVSLFTMATGTANAQVKQRVHNQRHRIAQGVKRSELTKAETKDLAGDQKEIHQDVKLAKSDGRITAGERRIITKKQRKKSREIYRKKHNSRKRH